EHLAVAVLELLVDVAEALDLGRAHEGEVLRIEEHAKPLALVGVVGHVDEGVVQVIGDSGLEVEAGELVADGQHARTPWCLGGRGAWVDGVLGWTRTIRAGGIFYPAAGLPRRAHPPTD